MERWGTALPVRAGPRIRVGYALAQLELVALLHAVLRRYVIERARAIRRRYLISLNGPRESGLFLEARAALGVRCVNADVTILRTKRPTQKTHSIRIQAKLMLLGRSPGLAAPAPPN